MERPNYLWMRVAIHLHKADIPNIARTFKQLAQHYYIHDAAVLLNAGMKSGHMASNYTLSLTTPLTAKSFYNSLTQCGVINSVGGEVGVGISSIPAQGCDQFFLVQRSGLILIIVTLWAAERDLA